MFNRKYLYYTCRKTSLLAYYSLQHSSVYIIKDDTLKSWPSNPFSLKTFKVYVYSKKVHLFNQIASKVLVVFLGLLVLFSGVVLACYCHAKKKKRGKYAAEI